MSKKTNMYIFKETYKYAKRDPHISETGTRPPFSPTRPGVTRCMSKETYRDLHVCQKKPTETYMYVKRDLQRPTCMSKETYRDLHVCQKRPTETYMYVKRDLQRPTCMSQETYKYFITDLHICPRQTNMSKATCKYVKRDLHICQTRNCPLFSSARYIYVKRDLHYVKRDLQLFQKRPTDMSEETYIHVKRDLHFCQKRPTYMSKGTYMYFKRDLHIFQKTICTCPKRMCSPKRTLTPYSVKKDTYIYVKRNLHFFKETYIYVKGDLHIFQKTTCTCPKRTCSPKRTVIPYRLLLHLKCHSFNLILQSQSEWSFFSGTWQKRRRSLDHRLGFEIGEMTLQTQYIVHVQGDLYVSFHIHVKYRSLSIYMSKENYRSLFICNRLYMSKKICMSLFVYKRDL